MTFVRAFMPPAPSHHAKLMLLTDGIFELRQKGASLRFIRTLLATVGVAVGTVTIAQFLAAVNGGSEPQPTSKRPARPRHVRDRATHARSAVTRASTIATAAVSTSSQARFLQSN